MGSSLHRANQKMRNHAGFVECRESAGCGRRLTERCLNDIRLRWRLADSSPGLLLSLRTTRASRHASSSAGSPVPCAVQAQALTDLRRSPERDLTDSRAASPDSPSMLYSHRKRGAAGRTIATDSHSAISLVDAMHAVIQRGAGRACDDRDDADHSSHLSLEPRDRLLPIFGLEMDAGGFLDPLQGIGVGSVEGDWLLEVDLDSEVVFAQQLLADIIVCSRARVEEGGEQGECGGAFLTLWVACSGQGREPRQCAIFLGLLERRGRNFDSVELGPRADRQDPDVDLDSLVGAVRLDLVGAVRDAPRCLPGNWRRGRRRRNSRTGDAGAAGNRAAPRLNTSSRPRCLCPALARPGRPCSRRPRARRGCEKQGVPNSSDQTTVATS